MLCLSMHGPGMGNKCAILGHDVFSKRDWDSVIEYPSTTYINHRKNQKGKQHEMPSFLFEQSSCRASASVSLTLQEGQLHVSLQVTSCHGHVIRLAHWGQTLRIQSQQHSAAPVFVDVSLIKITIELQFPYRNPETNGTGHDLRVDWIPKVAPLEHLHEIGMRLAVRASVSDAALPAGGEIPYPLHSHAHKFIIHIVFTICSHKNIWNIYVHISYMYIQNIYIYIYIYKYLEQIVVHQIFHTHTHTYIYTSKNEYVLNEYHAAAFRAQQKHPFLGIRWGNLVWRKIRTCSTKSSLCCIHFSQHNLPLTLPKTNTTHWTWMVGRLLSSWEGLFSGAKNVTSREGSYAIPPAGHRCASWQSCHLDPVRRKEYRQGRAGRCYVCLLNSHDFFGKKPFIYLWKMTITWNHFHCKIVMLIDGCGAGITFYLPLPTTPVFPWFPIDWHLPLPHGNRNSNPSDSFECEKPLLFARDLASTSRYITQKKIILTVQATSIHPINMLLHVYCLILNGVSLAENSWQHQRISPEWLIRKLLSALQLVAVKHFPLNKSPLQSSLGCKTGSKRQSPYIIREDMTWYDTHQDTTTHTFENATHKV